MQINYNLIMNNTMQNNENFSFESMPKDQAKENTAQVTVSEKLLQQLITALTPKPFYKRHPIIFWGGIIIVFFIVLSSFLPEDGASAVGGDCIAVVRIEGVIADTKETLEWINKISKDDSVRGVLLRIDSPGGGAAASQELYSALLKLGRKKLMVASMGSTAASGGLMVAMAAEHIIANPSTATGSIGVRMDIPQVYDIMKKIGVDQLTLKTAPFKDAGAPTRPMTEEERNYLEAVLDDMHEQFVLLIAEGRKMPVEKVRPLADGRIFTGRAAKDFGLVDELGGQDVALAVLYKGTGVDAEIPLYEQPDPAQFWRELGGEALGIDLGKIFNPAQNPAFLYQY